MKKALRIASLCSLQRRLWAVCYISSTARSRDIDRKIFSGVRKLILLLVLVLIKLFPSGRNFLRPKHSYRLQHWRKKIT